MHHCPQQFLRLGRVSGLNSFVKRCEIVGLDLRLADGMRFQGFDQFIIGSKESQSLVRGPCQS